MANEVTDPWPSELRVRDSGRMLRISFEDGLAANIPAERLRASTPSVDKSAAPAGVAILDVETIGNYAARFTFSDGHETGIYSWGLLRRLAETSETASDALR